MRRVLPILLVLILVPAASAWCQPKPRVLLVAADESMAIDSVQNYLADLDMFRAIDTFDAWHNTPTLELMDRYCCVLVWSNTAFADAEALGDRLADYVDGGKGVVLASMALMGDSPVRIQGRILGYSPLVPTYGNAFSPADLGWYNAAHPIMAGVDELGGYYRDRTELADGAKLVALWDDGLPLVGVGPRNVNKGRVIAIAMFPNDVTGFPSGDYPRLFGNALAFACPIPEPGLVTLFGFLGLGLAAAAGRRR
jgi:hypothetical protein